MKEDIMILEEFKKNGYHLLVMKYGDRHKANLKVERALDNLIKGYRELEEKYNNELDEGLRMSEWLVQKQKQIEELEYRYNKALSDLSIDAHKLNESQYIIKLKDEEYRNIVDIIQKDSIPKSKIKEKIEEYKQEMKEIRAKEKGLIWNHRLHKLDYAIQVLQELIEEE